MTKQKTEKQWAAFRRALEIAHSLPLTEKQRAGLDQTTHGQSGTRTYASWSSMKSRCSNPKNSSWEYYGGRGITVCAKWQEYTNFLADMGERPLGKSLDRIDSNGNYEPGNVRWATPSEQIKNRRPFKKGRV
jgi:hypothetical protein